MLGPVISKSASSTETPRPPGPGTVIAPLHTDGKWALPPAPAPSLQSPGEGGKAISGSSQKVPYTRAPPSQTQQSLRQGVKGWFQRSLVCPRGEGTEQPALITTKSAERLREGGRRPGSFASTLSMAYSKPTSQPRSSTGQDRCAALASQGHRGERTSGI